MFKSPSVKRVMGIFAATAISDYVFKEWKKGPNPEEVKQRAEKIAANAGKTETFYGASGFPVTMPTMTFGSKSND